MTLTALGKNAALTGSGVSATATHVGLLQAGTAITGVTGVTSTDTFTKTAHGLANGTAVLLSGLTGGSGLVAGRVYFVVATAANTFQLALTPGGTAVDLVTDVTAATVTAYTELSGGSPAYTRVTNSWNTAVDGSMDNNVVGADINVPAAATVNAIGAYSAISAGNLIDLAVVTPEGPYGAQGLYQVTDYDINLNAAL